MPGVVTEEQFALARHTLPRKGDLPDTYNERGLSRITTKADFDRIVIKWIALIREEKIKTEEKQEGSYYDFHQKDLPKLLNGGLEAYHVASELEWWEDNNNIIEMMIAAGDIDAGGSYYVPRVTPLNRWAQRKKQEAYWETL